jgi:hypothetical protein
MYSSTIVIQGMTPDNIAQVHVKFEISQLLTKEVAKGITQIFLFPPAHKYSVSG